VQDEVFNSDGELSLGKVDLPLIIAVSYNNSFPSFVLFFSYFFFSFNH